MVSDKLQELYNERDKRKAILDSKPDSEWARKELRQIEREISKLEPRELDEEKDAKMESMKKEFEKKKDDAEHIAKKADALANS